MIQLEGVQKVLGGKTAIDIPTLRVAAGAIAAVVGPVDSGREVLFELLTGRSRPTAGEILLDGVDPFADRECFGRRVGIVFSEANLYTRQSALSNLKFYCRLRRLPLSRATEVLARVGLADQAETRVGDLPSSLVRRLAFGRAILHEPRVLLLADPFAQCDEASISLLRGLMHKWADEGAALLHLSKDAANLDSLCDTVYHLEQGRVADMYRPVEERRSALPFMIPAKMADTVALVNPADILYAVAQDDRAYLHTKEGQLPTQFTLTELEQRLIPSGFFRAHRGYLVNLQHVREVIPYTRNSFTLRLKDPADTEIPLSKSSAAELRKLLGY